MRDLGTKHLLVAGFVFVLIHSTGGSDACLANPTDSQPALSSIPKPSNEVNTAADTGMTNLIKYIQNDKERAASIGFYSADEVTNDKMKRGSGIPVLKIIDKSLVAKPDFKSMSEYLEPLDQFMYPITVDGKARAVINVKKLKKDGKWKAVSYGAPGLISALEELKLLDSDEVFIARYLPLGIWLACTSLDNKSQCHQITANPTALDYKTNRKVWPKHGPVESEPIGEVEASGARAEAGLGRAEAPGARAEAGLGRAEVPGARAETGLGRAEVPGARAEAEVASDKDEDIPLVNIGKGENGSAVLRSLADMATKRKPYELDDKTSRLKGR